MKSPEGPVGVFDRAAAVYDAVGVAYFEPIAEGLVAELAPRPGERALDVGCGRGAVLAPLARLVGSTGHAVGIDLAPEMVRRTTGDFAHLAQVRVRLDDAQKPSLPPRSFDVVVSSMVLFFLVDPGAALARWVELLVPGGRLGVTTFGKQDPAWSRLDTVLESFVPTLAGAPAEAGPGPFDSDVGVESLLLGAGAVDVQTVTRTLPVRFRDVDHFLAFSWSHGQRALWEAVPEETHGEVRAAIAVEVEALALRGTEIVLEEHVRYTLGRRRN